MVESVSGLRHHIALSLSQLLTNGEIVAIVDDDPSIRGPLKEYLKEKGLAVEERASAGEFLELLKSSRVALVVLDIGLPDMDGTALIPQIVESHPDVAIIMLTGPANKAGL